MAFLEGQLERAGDDVGRLINVAQTMGLVDDHEVPRCRRDIRRFVAGGLVGADDDEILHLEGAEVPLLDRLVVGFCLQYTAGQEELFRQFLMPLLAEA